MLPAAPLADPTLARSAAVEHGASGDGAAIAVTEGAGAGTGAGAGCGTGGRVEDEPGAADEGIAAGVVDGITLGAACAEAPDDRRLAPGWLCARGCAGELHAAVSAPAQAMTATALASSTGMASRLEDAKSVIGAAFSWEPPGVAALSCTTPIRPARFFPRAAVCAAAAQIPADAAHPPDLPILPISPGSRQAPPAGRAAGQYRRTHRIDNAG